MRRADLELRQLAGDVLVDPFVGDPSLQGLPLLGPGELEGEEQLGEIQDLLVDLLRALGDQADADPVVAADLDQAGEGVQHAGLLARRVLRGEFLALFEEQVHRTRRRLHAEEEAVGEGAREAGLVGVALELADVEHDRDAAVDDEVRDERAGAGLERDVAVQAAEHGDRQAWGLAVARQAQPVPDADRIEDDELRGRGVHFLGELLRGVGLAGSGATEEGELLGHRAKGQAEGVGDLERAGHMSCTQAGAGGPRPATTSPAGVTRKRCQQP